MLIGGRLKTYVHIYLRIRVTRPFFYCNVAPVTAQSDKGNLYKDEADVLLKKDMGKVTGQKLKNRIKS